MLLAMIITLVLLCITVGLAKISEIRENKKHESRTEPMDEKEMYW